MMRPRGCSAVRYNEIVSPIGRALMRRRLPVGSDGSNSTSEVGWVESDGVGCRLSSSRDLPRGKIVEKADKERKKRPPTRSKLEVASGDENGDRRQDDLFEDVEQERSVNSEHQNPHEK